MAGSNTKSFNEYLEKGIWKLNTDEMPRYKRYFYTSLKVAILTVRQFYNDHIVDRAAAITYTTLFSIIPILALLFAIARGFGFGSVLEEQIKENSLLISQQHELVLSFINSYLSHAKSGIFIGVGILMLFVSVYFLTNAIEQNVNAIWQAKKPRNILRMITDYFSMLLIVPVLMVMTSGITIVMTTYVKQIESFLILGPLMQMSIRLIPYTITCIIFIALYIFVPNTHVKLKHVIIPVILAGSAFQAFQYFYINSQIWVSSYNAIYGSFAAIPLFLLWANISWVICLVGVEMSYLSQNLDSFSYDLGQKSISRLHHDYIAAILLASICKRLDKRQTALTAEELSKEIKLPIRLTKRILFELIDCQLIYSTTDERDRNNSIRYIPGVDINQLSIGFLLESLDTHGEKTYLPDSRKYQQIWEKTVKARKQFNIDNNNTLLKDL